MGVWGKGPAFEASGPSSALQKLAAWVANSFGVRYPKLLSADVSKCLYWLQSPNKAARSGEQLARFRLGCYLPIFRS